ncbi:MAG: transcriptional regulator [Planctomycetota bacterium]
MNPAKRVHRLLAVTEYLQSGRAFTARDLAEFCGVTKRTIFRDIALLREAGLQVVNDQARGGFHLTGPMLLPSTEFTLAEALALLVLCGGLDGDPAVAGPFAATARTAARKLLNGLPGKIRDDVGELSSRIESAGTQLTPTDEAGKAYAAVEEAMRTGRKVRIRYDSFTDGKVIQTLLSPYRVIFFRRAWYVIGRSSVHRQNRTFHLGRVVGTEPTDDAFTVPPRFSLARYFGDAWQFIREKGDRHEVVVRFAPLVARNVAEVRWHRTQQNKFLDDGSLEFRASVEGLTEIVWWVLGYGREAEVIEPQELRDMVAGHADDVRKMYRR